MPRYFFPISNRVRIADPYGTLLANNKLAWAHAIAVGRELIFKRSGMLGQAWSHWTLRVNDANGKTIHTIALSELPDGDTKH